MPPAAVGPPPCDLVSGSALVYRKSRFLASVARVRSAGDAATALAWLRAQPRVAHASHTAIYAWTCATASGGRAADCDDDGEAAAGSRLAHLLAAIGAENTLVVVTRWFGGILLGPARFKIINDVARALIEAQPWHEGRTQQQQRRWPQLRALQPLLLPLHTCSLSACAAILSIYVALSAALCCSLGPYVL